MDLKLKKKISKMSMEELKEFLDENCKTKEDRTTLLSEYNNNPYIELSEKYKDIKNNRHFLIIL